MSLKLTDGVYELSENGLPRKTAELEEILQNAAIRLLTERGKFIYNTKLGSELGTVDLDGEHAEEQVAAYANGALADMLGVTVSGAKIIDGGKVEFTICAPMGEGKIIYAGL